MQRFSLLLLLLFVLCTVYAQKKKLETLPGKSVIEARTDTMKKYEGFVNFFYDEKNDRIHLLLDKWDTEFLYVESLTAGIGSNDIGLDRNQLGRERIVKWERRGPKVLMIQPNYFYRAKSDNVAERKAVEEAFAQSILWGFTVEAEENGKVLVDATDFFLQDAHNVINTLKESHQGDYSLDISRSAFYLSRVKNFPKNAEFEVTLTFKGDAQGQFIQSVTPTPSSVSIRQHHSFVELPDLNFKPRKFDPRAGYFSTSYYDYATPIGEPLEKRFITRHRLAKKDPGAAISEAVKPIVYYMDPGAPEPIRTALMEGARWWNQAFEAAGYKDAFRVELLPDNADPMDLRYNLINWVHRSTRGWSYGATVTDPRTGEIIKGHVTLGSLRVRQDYLIAESLLAAYEEGKPISKEMEQMALSRLRQLAAHEVGHTIGLAHAYSSSSEGNASVMDYPHPNIKLTNGKIDLSEAYDNKIGRFDKVSIAFGYQDFAAGVDEDKELNKIIQNSLQDGLTFLSDQDARPVGGSHPFAHLWDNGKDASDELNRILEIRAVALRNFSANNIRMGMPMATLEEVLVPVYFLHRYQTEATVKMLGGLNYRYALRGDGQLVTEMLSPAQEIKAIEALLKTIDPAILTISENILRIIPPRPIGYERHREVVKIRTGLNFDPVATAESAANMTIGLMLNPARASRMIEHHARETRLPGLENLIDRLITVTLHSAPRPGLEGAVQMAINASLVRNLSRLAANKEASAEARAIANLKMDQLKTWLGDKIKITLDEEWKAHYTFMQKQIGNADDSKSEDSISPPPGAPIGEYDWDYCGY